MNVSRGGPETQPFFAQIGDKIELTSKQCRNATTSVSGEKCSIPAVICSAVHDCK